MLVFKTEKQAADFCFNMIERQANFRPTTIQANKVKAICHCGKVTDGLFYSGHCKLISTLLTYDAAICKKCGNKNGV